MKNAATSGSYDPIHLGHIAVINDGIEKFGPENIQVIVGYNEGKNSLFHPQERIGLINTSLGKFSDRIKVVFTKDVLVDFFVRNNIGVNIKGLRDESDLVYEKNLEYYNRILYPNLEVMYIQSKKEHIALSSSGIKELFKAGGNLTDNIEEIIHLSVKHALELRLNGQGIIGVTGVPGSGKSYVSEKATEQLQQMNISTTYISMDKIAHYVYTSPQYKFLHVEITQKIGGDLLDENGNLDRKKLGDIVFSNGEKMNILNDLMRQPILTELRYQLRGIKGVIIIENAIFAELGITQLVNNNLVHVTIDEETQDERLMKRKSQKIDLLKQNQLSKDKKYQLIQDKVEHSVYGKQIMYENNQESIDHNLAVDMLSTVDRDGSIRITSALTKLGLGEYAKEIYIQAMTMYLNNNLPYHNWKHILDGLDQIYRNYNLFENTEIAIVAWLFHDVIYNTTRKENEKKSGQLACDMLRRYGLNEATTLRIYDLIIGTTHNSVLADLDEQLLADIDLSILSRDIDQYIIYTQNIRKEYSQYPDEVYNLGRMDFMTKFLQREKIYYTSAYQNLESQARINIEKEVLELNRSHD